MPFDAVGRFVATISLRFEVGGVGVFGTHRIAN